MSKYIGVDIACSISDNFNNKFNKNNKGELNMKNVERILGSRLEDYEIANKITNRDMKRLLNEFQNELESARCTCIRSWFQSESSYCNKLRAIVQKYKYEADDIVEEYKETIPGQVNRFILETAELQIKYVGRISKWYASQISNAILTSWNKEMKYMMIKSKPVVEKMENKVENINKQAIKETVNARENGDEIDMKSLYNEILALREEVQELKNQIK